MFDRSFISPPEHLHLIKARTEELKFNMASEDRTGALLQVLAASKPGGKMLELGTGTGIGTSWLLSGMDETATLVSVETDAILQDVACKILGRDKRLRLLIQDAAAFLRKQPQQSFDLVFADAMPGKFESLDDALAIVKPGGFYIIDDLLPQANWPAGHGDRVDKLIHRLSADPRFAMLPMTWASGIAVLTRLAPPSEPLPKRKHLIRSVTISKEAERTK
jgi:predicted O-methyltransferase YrrM